jgi:hypothetical protein
MATLGGIAGNQLSDAPGGVNAAIIIPETITTEMAVSTNRRLGGGMSAVYVALRTEPRTETCVTHGLDTCGKLNRTRWRFGRHYCCPRIKVDLFHPILINIGVVPAVVMC